MIEILVVIGMIAILATIVIIAINPARQFAQGRNTQRLSNINTILNAIGQNIVDNKGSFVCSDGSATNKIDADLENISSTSSKANIMPCLVPTYISSVLVDPDPAKGKNNGTSSYDTDYFISKDLNGRYTIVAKGAELEQAISVTR